MPDTPDTPDTPETARTATEIRDLQDHTTKVMVDEFNKPPPPDGSSLPPIAGDVKITTGVDGVATTESGGSKLPPVTGRMAVTEDPDMPNRRKPATK